MNLISIKLTINQISLFFLLFIYFHKNLNLIRIILMINNFLFIHKNGVDKPIVHYFLSLNIIKNVCCTYQFNKLRFHQSRDFIIQIYFICYLMLFIYKYHEILYFWFFLLYKLYFKFFLVLVYLNFLFFYDYIYTFAQPVLLIYCSPLFIR